MLVKHLHREVKMTFLKLCHFSLIVVTFKLNELHRLEWTCFCKNDLLTLCGNGSI